MEVWLLVLLVVLALAVLCAAPLALRILRGGTPRGGERTLAGATGGAERRSLRLARAKASPHVIVDTLNLAHHLRGKERKKKMDTAEIAAAIDRATPLLRERFKGKIVYVVKDRDTVHMNEDARELLRQAAERNRVSLRITERYVDPPHIWRKTGSAKQTHQKAGRDDFYIGLLAWKLRCGVLTRDRMKDFRALKYEVPPFLVYEYEPYKERFTLNQVRPNAGDYARVLRPVRFDYKEFGL